MGNKQAVPGVDADMQQTEELLRAIRQHQAAIKLLDDCFNACVHDFTTRKILTKETTCTNYCVDKNFATVTRMSEYYAAKMTSEQLATELA